MRDKRTLVRVVHNEATKTVTVDLTGKAAGRGAYVCNNADCLAKAAKNKGLEKSFKHAVPKEVYEKLKDELAKASG